MRDKNGREDRYHNGRIVFDGKRFFKSLGFYAYADLDNIVEYEYYADFKKEIGAWK